MVDWSKWFSTKPSELTYRHFVLSMDYRIDCDVHPWMKWNPCDENTKSERIISPGTRDVRGKLSRYRRDYLCEVLPATNSVHPNKGCCSFAMAPMPHQDQVWKINILLHLFTLQMYILISWIVNWSRFSDGRILHPANIGRHFTHTSIRLALIILFWIFRQKEEFYKFIKLCMVLDKF